MPEFTGHRALVTGASSGIGRELARQLAAAGCDLVLTARRADRLEQLASELRSSHPVDIRCLPEDLAERGAPERLFEATEGAGLGIDILVNSAGFGDYHAFAEQSWERNAEMLQVNLVALVELTHRFLGPMLERGRRGYVLNISSFGAYLPVAHFATYTASKHFVLAFSESLAAELAGSPVSVTCVCPGGARTEFIDRAQQKVTPLAMRFLMDPDQVARTALRAMVRGRRNVVIGLVYKLSCFMTRFVPHRTAAAVATLVLGPPDPQATASNGRAER